MGSARWLFLVFLAASLAACGDTPAGPAQQRAGAVVLDAGALFGSQEQATSVIERAVLRVTSAAGSTTHQAPVGPLDEVATFTISVPPGQVLFEAVIESNNGAVLFEGSNTITVEADGFQVPITLVAVRPVLMVFPDSLRVEPPEVRPLPRVFALRNRGKESVVWSVESVTPALDSCGIFPCLRLGAFSGAFEDLHFLPVWALNTPERVYRIRLASPEGTVELLADAAAASPQAVIEAVVANFGGPPIPGAEVRLDACSEGSQVGTPGVCNFDESFERQIGVTDQDGIARFSGLPDGFWRVSVDPQAWGFVSPGPAVTLRLEPAEIRRILFEVTFPID